MKKITLLLLSFLIVTLAFAQKKAPTTIKNAVSLIENEVPKAYCATDELHNGLMKVSPGYQKKFNDMNDNWQKWAIERANIKNNKSGGGSVTTQSFQNELLPVIFHRMVNGASTPITSSITNAQLTTALARLNDIYAGVANGSKPASTNTQIQFCLAQVDNFGAAITTNTYTNPSTLPLDNTNQGQINVLSNVVQNTGKFPTTKYINIYIVEDITSPVAGFAYMPSSHGNSYDGIYIEAQYLIPPSLPNDLSYNMTVLAHEMGHYLGLFHTFGICNAPLTQTCSCYNNNCLFDGDMICDTPPDFSQAGTSSCSAVNTCTTDAAYTISAAPVLTTDVNDLINNYMDYGNWNCQNSFTQGQINRMHFMLDEFVGPRNSLRNSNVCNATCVNNTCTVTINPITTTTINGVYLPNTLILSGPTVSYNFTGNSCTSVYNTINWSAINLANNTIFQTGTAANLNVTFSAIGNYRILLRGSIAGSSPLCYQTDTLDIQVLPPANCPANLDMSGGWNAGNWQRIQYEGGWARPSNGSSTFTFPTTTMTIVPPTTPNGVLNTDPTSIVPNLSGDPNFSSIPNPAGITNIMRVGKLITSTTTLPAGDASFVTYTFCPTNQNAKLKVYYLGMKEHDIIPVKGGYEFATNASGGSASSFGFVCKYNFNSIAGGISNRGIDHTGAVGSMYGKNDMMAGGIHTPTFSPIVIGGKNFDAMTGWESMVLDFSEFICTSPTITVTFFAKSDNASNLGFHHSYGYFAAQCLPASFKDIDLNLINKDIACANNVTASCVSENIPIPNYLPFYDNYNNYNIYNDLLAVDIEESNDNITYTPTSLGYSYTFGYPYATPMLNLCKTPDAYAYKYFKVTYRTLCQTLVDTMTIFQGFVHTINDCAPNPMSGGHYINPAVPVGTQTLSPDQYVQYCDSTTITLSPPCWWHSGDPEPEYQWQFYSSNIGNDPNNWMGVNTASLTVKSTWTSCTPFRRLAKYTDPYCNVPIWVPSDYIYASSLKSNNFASNVIGPDVCGNSLATININGLYETSSIFTCDPEYVATYSATPATNSISIAVFSSPSCSPSSSIAASSGSSVLSYTYANSLTFANAINTSFTFLNNGIYTTTGTAYILVTVNRLGCASSFTLPVTVKIKPSAIAGTISTSPCLTSTMSITGDNPNSTGYYWEYSYNSTFSPAQTLGASTIYSTNVSSSTFTAFPVYVRRVANGTTDCPNVAYSNTLTINNTNFTLTTSPSVTICTGNSATLTASGASSYTWMPGSVYSATAIVTPTTNTTYTVTGQNSYGCVTTKTLMVTVAPIPTLSIASSTTTVCSGSPVTFTASGATSYSWMPGSLTGTVVTVSPTSTTIYTLTGQNASGCKSTKTITITVNPGPSFEIGASSTKVCAKSSVTLTANGTVGNTYTWNPGGMTGSPVVVNPVSTTIYTVTASNGSGCTSTKTINVTVFPNPVITATGNMTICAGTSATLTASGASTYTWSAGTSSSTANPLIFSPTVTTVGSVTGISADGCVGAKNVTVTVLPSPTITLSGKTDICSGTSATLTATGATSYTWLPTGSGNPCVLSPTVTTTYTVIGSNGTCTTTKTVVITVIPSSTISVTGNTTICLGSSTTLTASGSTGYTWMPGSITSATAVLSPTTTTIYTVTGSGACPGIKTVTVNVLPNPVVSISGNTFVCSGNSTTLTATGGGTYSWSPSGATTASISTGISGINTVTVTGTNGCKSVNSVSVNIGALPSLTITPSTQTVCAGTTVTLTASGAPLYNWVPGNITTYTAAVTPTSTTVYTVTGTGKNGCSSTKTATVYVLPLPLVSISGSTFVCSGNTTTLTASGGGTYLWSPSGATTSSIVTGISGLNTVTVTGVNGCKSISSVSVNVGALPSLTITPATQTICAGSSTTLTASGAPLYNWMPGNITTYTAVVSPTATTVYTVTGFGKNGCSSTKTATVFTIPNPTVSVTGNTVICSGNTTILTASGGGTYVWNSGATTNSVVTGNSINTVTVTGTNGCKTIKTVTITVNQTPTITIVASPSVICAGSCATLTAVNLATNPTAYSWGTIPATTIISTTNSVVVCPTSDQKYYVTGSTKPGCSNTASIKIGVVTNDPAFNIVSAQVVGQSYYTNTVTPVVTNANLVSGFGEMYIVEEIVLSTSLTVSGTNSSLGTNPNPSCWWVYPNTLTFTGYNGTQNVVCPTFTPYPNGQFTNGKAYRITRGTWNDFCPWAQKSRIVYQSGLNFVVIDDNTAPVYSQSSARLSNTNNSTSSKLNIYPNPSNGLINVVIENANESNYSIELIDSYGKLLYKSEQLESIDSILKAEIDLRKMNFKTGLYLINIISNNEIQSQKIILE